ncbi:hypothetical protein GZS05_25115 [Klebsiella variicola]|nr:hypothetical protein GZS05_25115 [Klebsiella variicola]
MKKFKPSPKKITTNSFMTRKKTIWPCQFNFRDETNYLKQHEIGTKPNNSHTIHDYCIEPRKTFPYIFHRAISSPSNI